MMKTSFICFVLAVALAFAACGNSGGGGGGNVAAAPAPGVGPVGPGVVMATCQVGQIYSAQYGCLIQGSCPPSYGYVPQVSQCVQGVLVTTQSIYGAAPSAGRFYGTMAIQNRNQFSLLLKYAHLCDPYWVGWNWGSYNCDTYSGSGFIQLQYFSGMNTATTNATMFIGAGSGYGGNYLYSMSSGTLGFSQQARVADGNNSAGMFIDGVGPDGRSVGIKLVVSNGNFVSNPTLASFTAEVFYQNVKFATITFNRY